MTYAERIAPSEECAATIDFDTAQAILNAKAMPLGMERVPLRKAGRRVLAEPLLANIDSPRADTAAMDGFAVRDADVAKSQLRCVGTAYPASPFLGTLGLGEAVRITTGAPMPDGADRVLIRESVMLTGGRLVLQTDMPTKRHVRSRGSDIAKGQIVLPAGRVLDPRALLVAAAADARDLSVWRRPRVRVLTNGDELAEAGSASMTEHAMPDSLSEPILLLVRQWGGMPLGASRVPDCPERICEAAQLAIADSDILVIAGGASSGDRDFARAGLASIGLELAFAGVAIKPGKPVWYGRIGSTHVIGLPGNPTAAWTIARLFLVPLLTALAGRGFYAGLSWEKQALQTPAATSIREAFLCGESRAGGVALVERQSASAQLPLASANTLIRIPANEPGLLPGSLVDTLSL